MDPSYNNSFGSFGSGSDVVLSQNKQPKKKYFGIAMIVLVVLAIGGIVVAMLFMNKNSISADFKKITSFMETVPDNYKRPEADNNDNADDLLYAVLIADSNKNEISTYYDELNNKYNGFLERHSKEISEDLTNSYSNMLKILDNAINYTKKEDMMVEAYKNGGEEAVDNFYSEKIDCEHKDEILDAICSAEEEYYETFISEYTGVVDYDINTYSQLSSLRQRFRGERARRLLSNAIKRLNKQMLDGLNG